MERPALSAEEALHERAKIIAEQVNSTDNNGLKSVALFGPPRVGKTIVSDRLALLADYRLIRLDLERTRFLKRFSKVSWSSLREGFISDVASNCRFGAVIEGADIFEVLKGSGNFGANCAFATAMARVSLICIGAAQEAASDKCTDIIEYRKENACWTNKLQPRAEQVLALSKHLIEMSRLSKDLSAKIGCKYYELGSRGFHANVETICTDILLNTKQAESSSR